MNPQAIVAQPCKHANRAWSKRGTETVEFCFDCQGWVDAAESQAVASGVEGAHEGTTPDKKAELPREHQCVSANDCPLCDEYIPAGAREPEKLNNAQLDFVQVRELDRKFVVEFENPQEIERGHGLILFRCDSQYAAKELARQVKGILDAYYIAKHDVDRILNGDGPTFRQSPVPTDCGLPKRR